MSEPARTKPATPEAEPPLGLSRRRLLAALPALGLLGLGASPFRPASGQQAARALATGDALPEELWRASAGELADAIARREVSSREVVDACLARIEAVNPQVNAVVRTLAEPARAAAAVADRAVAAGEPLGPLHGVPIGIKENVALAGTPTTDGVPALAEAMSQADAPVVERMKGAGAIPLARTNLPDFALRVHTFSGLHGRTLNPFHPERNVGGSSGGDAAALATGMVPLGLGNDIGGSLRNPAHCCGIVALKPTLGRIPSDASPDGGGPIGSQLMAVQGPMARRVADVDRAYRVLAGRHVSDPWSMPVPLEGPPIDGPITVALVPEPSGGTTHPSLAAAVRETGAALEAAGYRVEEIEPPDLPGVHRLWGRLLATELEMALPQLAPLMSEEALAFLEPAIEYMEPQDFGGYAATLRERQARGVQWSEFQNRYPLILGPVFTQPPFPVGYDTTPEGAADVLDQLRLVVSVNILGLPAVALPAGLDGDGLPRGLQVIGDRYREDLCLEAAAVIERALGTLTPIDPRG